MFSHSHSCIYHWEWQKQDGLTTYPYIFVIHFLLVSQMQLAACGVAINAAFISLFKVVCKLYLQAYHCKL